MRNVICALVMIVLGSSALASDIAVANVRAVEGGVAFDLSWENAWRHERNHDAAWVLVTYRAGARFGHARILSARLADGPEGSVVVAPDGVGAFIAPGAPHRGRIGWSVTATLDPRSVRLPRGQAVAEFVVHAIEMVRVPAGGFWFGESDGSAGQFGCFYRVGADGRPDGPYHVGSEGEIAVGPAPGGLFQFEQTNTAMYSGDRGGPIPAAFPKGTREFYCMKYEITQGQYAAFLNSLSVDAQAFRSPVGGPEYERYRGSIRLIDGVYEALAPDRPLNFISWDDGCAFADWAGLRPMTELEFEKACRGPDRPVARDFPWGTADTSGLARVMVGDDLVRDGAGDESRLDDGTRAALGASHYWIMDLAGSLWERCVTAGHPAGRAFAGTHGDGRLSDYGWATNADWPRGDDLSGGYGYRGGGFYTHDHDYGQGGFNPYSPVAWRRFGAWGQGPRYRAYGFRCVRSAP